MNMKINWLKKLTFYYAFYSGLKTNSKFKKNVVGCFIYRIYLTLKLNIIADRGWILHPKSTYKKMELELSMYRL